MAEIKIIFNIDDISDNYIEKFTREFIEHHAHTINGLAYNFYKDSSKLSMLAFQEIMHAELKKACYSFVNNGHNPNYIDSYLFSCIHKTIKNMKNEGNRNINICPGCQHLSKVNTLVSYNKKLVCNNCKNALISVKDKWEEFFYKTFAEHNRKGFICEYCNNFIPDSGSERIICPYPNCMFVGDAQTMMISRHPFIKSNIEIPKIIQDVSDVCSIDMSSSDTEISVKNDLEYSMYVLKDVIESHINMLHFKSNESTYINKLCMYNAFNNILDKYPDDMISYLVMLNKNVRIQHKIFQEFVRLLEEKIPFSFRKNGKLYEVSSLLDENLCVFDGISEYRATVGDKHEIPNLTEELYVGSRKGAYCRSLYIGKLLEVVDIDNGIDITSFVKEYSFSKITMQDNIRLGTNTKIRHNSIKPHYQMGGMVYLNRIRRAIVDKVYLTIHGNKRPIKK